MNEAPAYGVNIILS